MRLACLTGVNCLVTVFNTFLSVFIMNIKFVVNREFMSDSLIKVAFTKR